MGSSLAGLEGKSYNEHQSSEVRETAAQDVQSVAHRGLINRKLRKGKFRAE
jgi:hypothetical protein